MNGTSNKKSGTKSMRKRIKATFRTAPLFPDMDSDNLRLLNYREALTFAMT